MVENGLVNFDQKTGGKAIAFGFGETSQGMALDVSPDQPSTASSVD